MKRIILAICLVFSISCTSTNYLDADSLVRIFNMPTIPQIDTFSNFDLYSDKPLKITYMVNESAEDWVVNYVQYLSYKEDKIKFDNQIISYVKENSRDD